MRSARFVPTYCLRARGPVPWRAYEAPIGWIDPLAESIFGPVKTHRACAGTSYRARLSDAAAEVLRRFSRDLDRAAYPQKEDAPVILKRQPGEQRQPSVSL